MRINLARKNTGLADKFIKEHVRGFAEEYAFSNVKLATEYVTDGKQGLSAFVGHLNHIGYNAEIYHLDPNKELFTDVGDRWTTVSRTSPSYGFIILDSDPKLVEFKIKHA